MKFFGLAQAASCPAAVPILEWDLPKLMQCAPDQRLSSRKPLKYFSDSVKSTASTHKEGNTLSTGEERMSETWIRPWLFQKSNIPVK